VLEDNILGIIDNDVTHTIVDVEVSEISYIKSNQVGAAKGLVYYQNFMLSEKNTKFYRIAYTTMDVLGDIGGLIQALEILVMLFLIPFNYNITNITMIKDFI
jgi:hypothetical protein